MGARARSHDQAPGERMREVLARLSRDQWLPPSKVWSLAVALCRKHGSRNPTWTAKAYLPEMALHVCMLRGDAVCDRFQPGRAILIRRLQNIENRKDALALGELEVLHFVLKKGAYQCMRTR